jgi:ribosomal protein L7Ae-like RNA K-turn-binding protein
LRKTIKSLIKGRIWQQMERFEVSTHSPRQSSEADARQCLVTGETLSCDDMIRFVIAPDGTVTPDLDRRLPGQGLWVRARYDLIARAIPLFSQHASADQTDATVYAAADLASRVEALLYTKLKNMCGLLRKAGKIVIGFTKVSSALEKHRAHLVLQARDAALDGRSRIERLARQVMVPVWTILSSEELSRALGRPNIMHVAVIDPSAAAQLKTECDRIMGYQPSE